LYANAQLKRTPIFFRICGYLLLLDILASWCRGTGWNPGCFLLIIIMNI